MNVDLALTLVISLLNLIQRARGEGRDITPAELDGLVASDDLARAALVEAIQRSRLSGG